MKNKRHNICGIFNFAPHYRLPIYKLMGEELGVDFYFCNKLPNINNIKKIDYTLLPTYRKEVILDMLRGRRRWKGMLSLVFKPYDMYIITPDHRNITQCLFLLLCKLMGKKVVAWWHGVAPGFKGQGRDWKEKKLFYRLFAGNFIYGDKAREYMDEIKFPAKNKLTIYNSLDYDVSVEKRKNNLMSLVYKEHFCNDYPVLLFIGRLTKVKRLDMIIKAHEMLLKNGIKTNVVFIGSGEEEESLNNSIPTEAKDYFWFRGPVYDENEISTMLYNADICVSPGNVGLTAIHALYYGLPTITNDNFLTQMPEHECIIPGETGAFFKDDDTESLATEIKRWLVCSHNREEVRNKCYRVADTTFNPHKQIEVIKEMTKKLF